jgi:hypothetical protein
MLEGTLRVVKARRVLYTDLIFSVYYARVGSASTRDWDAEFSKL